MLSTLSTNNAVASENHQSNAPVNQSQQLSKKKQKTIKNFSIEIEDNRTTFLPGQRIDGHIALEVTQPIDVKLLRIRFSGTVASHLHRNDTPLINPNSDISLFKDLQNCIGSTSLSEAPVQIEGESVYPFSFRLPPLNLPTSFCGRHGRVFYEIAAVLVRPGHVNKAVSLDLTVPSTVDSLDPIYNDPVEKACTVPVGQWIFNSGHMELKGSIPRSAYAPEDIVPLKVEILNQSDSVLKLLNISLKQKTIYKTSDEILGPQTEKIHKLNFTEIYPSNLKRITRHIQFPIPTTAIISPSIKTSILEVNHFLVVKVHVKPSFTKKKNPESSKDSHMFKQILNIFSKKKPIPTAKQQEQPEFKMQVYHPDEEDSLNDRSSFPNNVSRSSSIEDPSNRSSVHENSPPRLLSVLTSEPTQDSDTDSIPQRNHHQSMIITPSSPLTQQLNRSSSTPNFALNTESPSVRPLKLKNQSWLRLGWKKKTVKIEIPIVIAGFPYVLLDVANGGRRSIDTLPIYLLGNARSDDVEGNGDENILQ